MMGARTGDQNAPIAGEKRGGLEHRKHRLSSSGCLKKCSNRPGRSSPSSEPFSFIKVMIGPYTEALIIPPKARPKLKCLLDRNVCLEDSEMQTYLVKVSIFNGALAFRHGWDQFLSDHCIKYGEVVVFNYTTGSKFSVQIYGVTGCERTCFPRSCQANLKRKKDEVESSNFNLLHRGSKPFGTAKEQQNFNLEATTREMSLDIALDFSNSDQPSCGAVTELHVDGNIYEKSGIQHDNKKKPQAYSAVNHDKALCDGAVTEPNGNSNISEKSGIQHDNLKKPHAYCLVNCDITPKDGAGTESKVNSNTSEKSGIEHDNVTKPQAYSMADCYTTPCELTVEDPIGNPESKTGSINSSMEQGIENQEGSFYYTCIDLSKGSEFGKSVGSKANKMKGLKANKKRDPSKGQFLSAITSVKSQNMLRKDSSTEMEMQKTVVPVCSSIPMMNKAKNITENSTKFCLKEGKPLCYSNSGNPDKLAVAEGKVFLDVGNGQANRKSSNIYAATVNQVASPDGAEFHSRYLEEPKNRENIQSSATELFGNAKEVKKSLYTKEASNYSATNSTARHNNETATLLPGYDLEHLAILDDSSCRFVVNGEGLCFVVEEDLILEQNLSTIIPIEIDDSDIGIERCKDISPDHHHMSKRPLVEPGVEQSIKDERLTCHTKEHSKKQQGSLGCLVLENSQVVLPIEKAECVDHPVTQPVKSPECHAKTALVGDNSQLVLEENMNKVVAPKAMVGALVKVESVDSIMLSSISPVKLIVPITIVAQPWLELPTALPLKGKKDGGKVVMVRDPCMRTWPVLYHDSYRFIGLLGGWFALALANNLQPGDACELEVLAELDMILVHIK